MPILPRRDLLKAAIFSPLVLHHGAAWAASGGELPDLATLATPISTEERSARVVRAQALMRQHGIGAVVIEPGASLTYFTGIRWGRSERLTCVILPVEGQPCVVTPFFEAPSVRETLALPAEFRVWQEHEDPLALVAGFLKDRKLAARAIAMEETNRYFIIDGLKRALPSAKIVSANPVVRGCRMIKTPAELRLIQIANDITLAAYRWTYPQIEAGMSPRDIAALMNRATAKMGGTNAWNLILLGEASAYPHGSGKPQKVVPGEVVLMDCGCAVHGYQSDISRSFVFGEPNKEQRKVWDLVAKGQQVAMEAAQIGLSAGSVDDAVRRYYVANGYGPDYVLPGLSHRTGHGIGMDGHEPINLVRDEATPLAPGMCFSNEPGIYIPGSFGIRLEDCFYMTESGPKWFTTPPKSIDHPFN